MLFSIILTKSKKRTVKCIMMRIITGKARGIKLKTLEDNATRPTSERAKEAIFSMLQFDIEGRNVLDLFGGSGQLGLEAASRGALQVTIVDRSSDAVKIIDQNASTTKLGDVCRVVCSDWNRFLISVEGDKFDIIFIDPPYMMYLVPSVLESLIKFKNLKPHSIIVCESQEEDIFEGHEDLRYKFDIMKKAKYGISHMTILKLHEYDV